MTIGVRVWRHLGTQTSQGALWCYCRTTQRFPAVAKRSAGCHKHYCTVAGLIAGRSSVREKAHTHPFPRSEALHAAFLCLSQANPFEAHSKIASCYWKLLVPIKYRNCNFFSVSWELDVDP